MKVDESLELLRADVADLSCRDTKDPMEIWRLFHQSMKIKIRRDRVEFGLGMGCGRHLGGGVVVVRVCVCCCDAMLLLLYYSLAGSGEEVRAGRDDYAIEVLLERRARACKLHHVKSDSKECKLKCLLWAVLVKTAEPKECAVVGKKCAVAFPSGVAVPGEGEIAPCRRSERQVH